jgi:hypothetical protein
VFAQKIESYSVSASSDIVTQSVVARSQELRLRSCALWRRGDGSRACR